MDDEGKGRVTVTVTLGGPMSTSSIPSSYLLNLRGAHPVDLMEYRGHGRVIHIRSGPLSKEFPFRLSLLQTAEVTGDETDRSRFHRLEIVERQK